MVTLWVKATVAASVVGLTGCVAYQPLVTVLPQADGTYKMISTAGSESTALHMVQKDQKE